MRFSVIWTFFSSIAVGAGFLIGLTMIRFACRIWSGEVKHPQLMSTEQRGARVVHRWMRGSEAKK